MWNIPFFVFIKLIINQSSYASMSVFFVTLIVRSCDSRIILCILNHVSARMYVCVYVCMYVNYIFEWKIFKARYARYVQELLAIKEIINPL